MNLYNMLRMEMSSGTLLGYFLQAVPASCMVGIVYFVVSLVRRRKAKVRMNGKQELLRAAFACYLTGLVSLVVLPANFWLNFFDGIFFGWWEEMGRIFQLGEINLVPSVIKCLTGELSLGNWVKTMLLGNVAMFVPFGFFFALVTSLKDRKKLVLTAAVVPVSFEILQLFFGRSFDVDDLICNFIGIMLGTMIAFAVSETKSADVPKDG